MELKIDVEKINDGRAIPSTLVTILFLIFIFWMVQHVNIPQEARKPSEEMVINFLKEEKKPVKPEEKKKEEKEKEKEKEQPTEIQEEQILEETQEVFEQEMEEVFTEEEVAPNVIMPDMTDMSQELEQMLELPGGDGVTDLLTDLESSSSILDAGADAGGGMVGFGDPAGEANVNITNSKMDWGAHKKRTRVNKVVKGRRRPNVDLQSMDFISPIIRWMKAHPATFNGVLKGFLDYAPGNLTSKTKVNYKNKTYYIYLLCKESLPQLAICVVDFETEEVILIKNAGDMQKAGYLMEGEFMATVDGTDFGMLRGQQKRASNENADKFNDIFWSWFETVNPDK